MARQVVTTLIDDMDGSQADRTVEFGLDGVRYTIDLSEKNAGKLRKALDVYLAAATRVGRADLDRRKGRGSHATTVVSERERNRAIRQWALANGHDVSERGRISAAVVEAYDAAH
ncbi:histone-like nucleoid-structuring protein Lsr2 [Nucisporomicrobium flavum]|uniref:histone-like nucleoid-structuring protein Lsr2 n=1 Tax=Nucisporomicrobium flavum TaxID=2785915 RepID=UPI0018F66545|nr:Lsr2 family protein [Nucisporomicrobium flavum]